MVASNFVNGLPLWALFIITAAIVLLSIELGWRLGNYRRQRSEEENKAPVNAAVGAILGLLAFLLAFTFSMAASRFDTRKQNVLLEANAIGTTYLRTDLLAEGPRSQARSLLREYTALRAGGAASIMAPQGLAKTAGLQDQLWAIAASAGTQANSVSTGLFIQSLNEMIDQDTVRLTGLRNQIPDTIWLMLFVVTIFAMAAIGFEFGLTGARSWAVTIILVIVFSTVITLIADLDRPQEGLIQVSQLPLIDLLNKISTLVP